ncbi:hypothetical protein S7711_04350 [Stachybotrys chartarum IBT 7711]|uniref:Uncharacterized protein n=1 Tax=Stachybotrys chartarum (strain CBS 109288 / IBT 7711) TaxID=1280523 RepID=A0A084AY62_STACB|nr:hypothetical protein S7711_04350 [Stachybotrys chartarum IBT 7711]KFA48163.1 hypothetical protein S40293_06919 [Stachybotrys chartarum IBT 40293]
MAALPRSGFFLVNLRTLHSCRATIPEPVFARCRLFTTSRLFRKTASPSIRAVSPLSKTLPSRGPSAASGAVASNRYALIKSLAGKPTPTTLYEGPSHFWYYFGCWTSGVTILTWTLLTGPFMINQPEGTPQFVGWAYGAVYVVFGSIGFWLITKTPNIVHSIRLIPPKTLDAAAKASSAAGPQPTPQPQLEVTVKRMLPFLQPKVITKDLDAVTLKSRFSLPSEHVPGLRYTERKLQAEAQKKALRKFDMEHLLTMPFRRLGRGCRNLFVGVRDSWTDTGMGQMKIDGKTYKVDVTHGFAHDGFRTLERLVKVVGR